MTRLILETLGDYRIEETIARHGGGGAVYRARNVSNGRLVALKHLPAPTIDHVVYGERFRREMALAQRLRHQHIVPVLEAVELDDGDRIIAMTLIEGTDLGRLAASGTILPTRAVSIVEQLGAALRYAHGEGVVHRDVKPSNAMWSRGHVYLMDFGTARHPEDTTVTGADQAPGSAAYMSPEQARGRRATPKSDVYALTGVLYTLLTGRAPYPRDNPQAMILAHVTEPPPRPSNIRSDLEAFDEVIAAGMAKDLSDRLALDGLLQRGREALERWACRELPTATLAGATSPRSPATAPTNRVPRPPSPPRRLSRAIARVRIPLTATAVFVFTVIAILAVRALVH
jgi:serine/threonine protein kinase